MQFDFVDWTAKAYTQSWARRNDLVRLALVPLAIKILAFVAVLLLAKDSNFLRHGLILLPSYFAEGWFAAHAIRMVIFNETWPMQYSADLSKDAAVIAFRKRVILSGTVIYVLIKLTLAFLSGFVLDSQVKTGGLPATASPEEFNAGSFLAAIAVLVWTIWAFRLVWLYVPAVMNIDLQDYLTRFKAFGFSFVLLGIWLLCFVPAGFILIMASGVLSTIFPSSGDEPALAFTYGLTFVQAILELVIAALSSLAVAYGIQAVWLQKGDK